VPGDRVQRQALRCGLTKDRGFRNIHCEAQVATQSCVRFGV
jgi:hypothetical protein